MSDENKPQKSKLQMVVAEYWLVIFMLFLVLIALGFAYYIWSIFQTNMAGWQPVPNNFESYSDFRGAWGTTGDFFGGVLNPFFALLGLVMLLATLFQSQRELSLTRKELELSRKAAEESEKALADQALTQKQQRFENTFFNLIDQLNKITTQLKTGNYSFPWQNQNKLADILNRLGYDKKSDSELKAHKNQSFTELDKICCAEFRRYIGMISDILELINSYEKKIELRNTYTNLLSRVIEEDFQLLIIIGFLLPTYKKQKTIIESSGFFENFDMQHDDIIVYGKASYIIKIILTKEYNDCAFGSNSQYAELKNYIKINNIK